MKRHKESSIKDLLQAMIKSYGLEDKFLEVSVKNAYKKVSGPFILKNTTKIIYEKKILYVYVSSPVLKSEMLLSRSKIVEKINAEIGQELIEELRVF